MTRLGWSILALVLLAVAGFASLLSFGPVARERGAAPAAAQDAAAAGGDGAAADGALTVPVRGVPRAALADNWGDARDGGARAHHGIDIMAPQGTPVIAAADGAIEKLFDSRLGGITLYQRSRDGRWTYYYAHLAGYAAGIREGMRVRAGQALGFVGDTGDAGPGNYHLHFGLSRRAPGSGWWQGEEVNPYPVLARGHASR
jgi:murein DD-endopeptidase MepM/ murein hydrolase activator NlpD